MLPMLALVDDTLREITVPYRLPFLEVTSMLVKSVMGLPSASVYSAFTSSMANSWSLVKSGLYSTSTFSPKASSWAMAVSSGTPVSFGSGMRSVSWFTITICTSFSERVMVSVSKPRHSPSTASRCMVVASRRALSMA